MVARNLAFQLTLMAGGVLVAPVISAEPTIKHRLEMGRGAVVRHVNFSTDGKLLAVACGGDKVPGEIRLFSVADGSLVSILKAHSGPIDCTAFADGNRLVSGSQDKQCLIWDLSKRTTIGALRGHSDSVIGLSIRPGKKTAATSGIDKTVIVWDLDRATVSSKRETAFVFARLAYSPDGEVLVGGGEDGSICVWDGDVGRQIVEPWRAHEKTITSLVFTEDGKYLASASIEGRVKLWDTKRWQSVAVWPFGDNKPMSLAVAPNNKVLAVGLWNGDVSFHNISTSVLLRQPDSDLVRVGATYAAHDLPVSTLAFRSDGRMLASGCIDGTVKLWIDVPHGN